MAIGCPHFLSDRRGRVAALFLQGASDPCYSGFFVFGGQVIPAAEFGVETRRVRVAWRDSWINNLPNADTGTFASLVC